MKIRFSSQFEKSYAKLSTQIRQAFDKKLFFLVQNLSHPSLRAKKYDKGRDIWQARVTRNYRFYFRIENNTYEIIDITPHSK